jgi:hypothetical protein
LLAREGKREAAAKAMDLEVLKYLELNRFRTYLGAEFYSVMVTAGRRLGGWSAPCKKATDE